MYRTLGSVTLGSYIWGLFILGSTKLSLYSVVVNCWYCLVCLEVGSGGGAITATQIHMEYIHIVG